MHFDLFKVFGYIERVVKSEEKNRKLPILRHMCATFSELPSHISTMGYFLDFPFSINADRPLFRNTEMMHLAEVKEVVDMELVAEHHLATQRREVS